MSNKRKSEEPLQELLAESPASKRARVEDADEETGENRQAINLNGVEHKTQLQNTTEDEDEDEDYDHVQQSARRLDAPLEGFSDLYLDTINRSILDFDFEKLCSISLSNINVYACLVCGKYFQGRGPKSHAYFHALEEEHHVFINVETKKVYVLPEGYEVTSRSLDDIRYVVDPKYTESEVKKLDKMPTMSVDLANKKYRPGYIGMNNIKANDYLNVVIQALSHVATSIPSQFSSALHTV